MVKAPDEYGIGHQCLQARGSRQHLLPLRCTSSHFSDYKHY